jgi:hypothetical protein
MTAREILEKMMFLIIKPIDREEHTNFLLRDWEGVSYERQTTSRRLCPG